VGIIDHHALQSETIVTELPIFIDIRPWGSMSTMIAHNYIVMGRKPPPHIAGMLLCAIISDTLNLQGPTTTTWDKMMVSILAIIAGVEDINLLSSQQFKAKSKELAGLSSNQLVNGDQKVFKLKNEGDGKEYKVGFAVVETTDDAVIMDRKAELLPEVLAVKEEKGLDFLFLAVANIVLMRSNLLMCDVAEKALAKAAFGGPTSDNGTVMDLGNRVSRKKEFIPPLTSTMATFLMPSKLSDNTLAKHHEAVMSASGELFVSADDPQGKVMRRNSTAALKPLSDDLLDFDAPPEF
jgi:manganese-dependent inorganic pyrophosphatase